MLIALALAVATWSAGFDILYALQDVDFDREQRLHSVPVALGQAGALRVSRLLHVITILSLGVVGAAAGGGWLFGGGIVVVAALLVYEHSLVHVDDISRLDAAFFTMNGIISLTFFGFVLAERLQRAGALPGLAP